MNFKKTVGMFPLVIGLSSNAMDIHGTEFKFSEKDIKEKFIDVTLERVQYLNSVRIESSNVYLEQKFEEYKSNWEIKTMFYNFAEEIINDVDFQKIVKMGETAVPFILKSIEKKPSQLVWALNIIKNSNISKNKLTVSEACNSWVKWGKSNSII